MKKYTRFAVIVSGVVLLAGCTPKYIQTSGNMQYDITDVNVSTLQSKKICNNGSNKDISVTRIAKEANFTHVYAMDKEIVYTKPLFGLPKIDYICITAYGK